MKLKKIMAIFGVGLLGVALLAACGQSNKSSQKVTEVNVATVGYPKPFTYVDKGKLTGYEIEVVRAVFKDMPGYKVKFNKTSWTSIFTGLDSGKYDIGVNNISYTKDRAKKYTFSDPIAKNPLVIVAKKGSNITSLKDIGGHSTELVQGTTTAAQLEEWNKKHSSNKTNINYTGASFDTIMNDLEDGKFDYKVFDKISIENYIKKHDVTDLQVTELSSSQQPYNYMIFAKDGNNTALVKKVNARIKKLYNNGTLEKISQQYLGGSYLPDKKDIK